ncbi:2-hydroxyacid dehydrogenase [Nesterenkonia sp.]|uniref:2-hydroxyacid dehydrogenase n=1 Tax=Nesterenkonia sp. TaxID=704201 RepID=UPI002610EEED|nr:2-hydroxyacid dehydrogenase [Nesterenkonia sp.]
MFRASLENKLGDRIVISELEFPWPDEPFGTVGEVDEASGSEEAVISALEGVSAVVTQLAPLTERVLEASPQLKLIAVSRGGPTNVNLEAARRRGIRVANVPGRNGIATAEMTVGLALALLRRIPLAHQSMMENQWRGDLYRWDAVGQEAAGSVIGLVGAGAVGLHVAKIFRAMGADVLVYDPYLPDEVLHGVGRRAASLEDLFRQSSLVSIHARLTPETANMVNAELLERMPPGGLLVNAARGGVVDYDAVAESLQRGHLAGAAFDVYPEEPVDFGHKLFELARKGHDLVLTPHIAGASRETARRAAEGVAEEVRRFLDGEAALNPLVEPESPDPMFQAAR